MMLSGSCSCFNVVVVDVDDDDSNAQSILVEKSIQSAGTNCS